MTVSPLINSDRKGGALPIMLQQFRRAIGVAIIQGQANHKLARLHYVRAKEKRRRRHAGKITATTNGDQGNRVVRAGSRNTFQRDTIHSSNSEMVMTSVCKH